MVQLVCRLLCGLVSPRGLDGDRGGFVASGSSPFLS